MFKLIRRISYSVIPRPDRPWADDPTSNAPQTRKRRRSSSEFDQPGPSSSPPPNGPSLEDSATSARGEDGEASAKKIRREDSMDVSESGPSAPVPATTTSAGNPNINKRKSLGERYPIWGFSLGLGRSKAKNPASSETQQNGEQQETEDVKAVTKGVKDVEITDKDEIAPESVPLPIGDDDELAEKDVDGEGDEDEEVKDAAELEKKKEAKAEVEGEEKVEEQKEVAAKPDESQATNDDDDVASSANGEEDELQEIPAPVPHVEETHSTPAVAAGANVAQAHVSA